MQSQARLRALATELNLAEQRERGRLAVELHDHLQQLLIFGQLKVAQAKLLEARASSGREILSEIEEVLGDALKYTQTLVAELGPRVLRDEGLAAGLKWLGEYMKKRDLAVTVTVPEGEGLKVPEEQAVLLFQSVRELLINVRKHAGSGQAWVTMEQRDGSLRLEVRDEGKGFDVAAVPATVLPAGQSSKFGLFSIKERMTDLGGTFAIASTPGQGTTATLTLPTSSWLHGASV